MASVVSSAFFQNQGRTALFRSHTHTAALFLGFPHHLAAGDVPVLLTKMVERPVVRALGSGLKSGLCSYQLGNLKEVI